MLPLINKAGNPGRITILLVEDHALVREGVRSLLDLEAGFEVVGEAQDGRTAVSQVKKLRPAVVLMDIAMPRLNGLEAMRQILRAAPATRILILSAHGDDAYVQKAVEFGAAGFILKQSTMRVLAEGIRETIRGKTFFSPPMAKRLAHRGQKNLERAGREQLWNNRPTAREMEVLQLIAEGNASKQIAVELHIGVKTVEKHREHLMDKLDIHEIAGLTRYAICEGIIEASPRSTTVPSAAVWG